MEIQILIEELKELAGNDLNSFFEKLHKCFKADSGNFNTKIALQARYKTLKKQGIRGEISRDYENSEYFRILNSAIDFCDILTENDLNLSSEKKTISQNFTSQLDRDIQTLEKNWKVKDLVNKNTIILIVSTHIFSEITDRFSASVLKQIIDQKGNYEECKRAIIISDLYYFYDKSGKNDLEYNPLISIGGDAINDATLYIEQNSNEVIADANTRIVFNKDDKKRMIALSGITATDTKNIVRKFIALPEKGLDDFLNKIWN